MQEQTSGKSGNFLLFMVLTFGVVILHSWIFNKPRPPAQPPEKPGAVAKADPGKADEKPAKDEKAGKDDAAKTEKPAEDEEAEKPAKSQPAEKPEEEPAPEDEPDEPAEPPVGQGPMLKVADPRWFTLGSADPDDPFRMLVTVTDRGAAVARIELNSPRYRMLMDDDGYLAYTGGYLGRVAVDDARRGRGCPVEVVGPGTPAAKAGLKTGDVVTKIDGRAVTSARELYDAVAKRRPGRTVKLVVLRDGKEHTLEAKLTRPPMEVIRPEGDDPLSFLMTLSRIDKKKLPDEAVTPDQPKDTRPVYVDNELLKSVNLRDGAWEVVNHSPDKVEFRAKLDAWGLELVKIYRLEPIPKDKQNDPDYPAYNLLLDLKIRLADGAKRASTVAYQLDGPTGLPIEGWWFGNKVGRAWSAGLRDVVVSFNRQTPGMVGCMTIADDKVQQSLWHGGPDQSLTYLGVDAQYFSVVLIPKNDSGDNGFATCQPLRVGPVDPKIKQITDVTCRLRSEPFKLTPDGKPLEHTYTIFAGPKRPEILAHYGLDELVYYGWYQIIARPMVAILHFFYGIVRNYGLAILLLTVLVRGLMFPMSRKQALGAQKMAELQPELKRLKERHKKDLEAFGKAQRELFAKHNYNPLSGCLVLFVQLPIFVGLYNALRVDVELRGSPLVSSGLRWCSNLSAPDMLWDWHLLLPDYITYGIGAFKLGPYLNLLPLVTVVLFILQQKMFMPPPADEQQAMQQKIMKYMMIFIGVMFFKVASGLCVYFIASSLWSLAERQFLPKVHHAHGGAGQSNGKTPRPRK